MNVDYPAITDDNRTMIGVFSIEYFDDSLDQIMVGSKSIGFIQEEDGVFNLYPDSDINNPYPNRKSYEAVWQDVITHIANNLELAIEFTIKVQQKTKGDNYDYDNQ